jgi:glycosyltransferase involved in cell wall biosynthesis
MKITQVMLSRGFGGAERHFVELSVALAELGHEVQVIHHKKFFSKDSFAGLPITTAPVNVWGNWDVLGTARIQSLIVSFNPDVVHAHLARAAFMAGKACRKLKIPLVVKTHNYVDLKYYRQVTRFITPTVDQERYLQSKNITRDKIEVIPNFSSIKPVDHVNASIHTPATIVAYGRMVNKKGFDVLLHSIRKVHDRGLAVKLVLGGQGPEYSNLEKLCNTLGLEKIVEFKGWVDNIEEILKQADLFVLPSRDEPFGIVVLESMAKGVPIVTTRTQGPVEILDEGLATMVDINDNDALAEGIYQALTDYSNSRHKAGAALEKFITSYSKDVVVKKIEGLYRDLAGSGG